MTKRQLPVGGFDCEFVEPPPKVIIAECPICLHVLREPYQSTCCGKNFCRGCLEENKTKHSLACPCCKTRGFTSYPDKRLQQTLYDFKVYCPNRVKGCAWAGELRALDAHLDTNPPPEKCLDGCAYVEINCPLSYAGCAAKCRRSEMRAHLEEAAIRHMLMQMGRIKQLEGENQRLKRELDEKCDQIEELESDTAYLRNEKEELDWRMSRLEDRVDDVKTKLSDLAESLTKSGPPIAMADFTLHNFERLKDNEQSWCSPPFYTHSTGYKMCLRVDPNGWGDGRGSHISLHIYLMKGMFDELLKWPFLGEITVELLNYGNASYPITIMFTEGTPSTYKSRVTENEMAQNGWGYSRFVTHEELYARNYLTSDCLHFRVSKVEIKQPIRERDAD